MKNEAFLKAIIENIPDMIFVKDAKKLGFLRFNKAGEELLGYSREELIGKNDYDFFPKKEADFFTERDRDVINRGELLDIPEEPIQTKYKGERILHTKKLPVFDEEGKPRYLLGISEDITERKKAKESLLRERDKLKDAITRIKKLSGLLPICASCKKIRDDKGYWNQIETYIYEHSEAEFSHGICPECMKKLYPGYDI